MTMTPNRWRRVREVFDQAIEQPPETRDAMLERECSDDVELRSEVESLIRSYQDSGTFIDEPASRLEPPVSDLPEHPDRIGVYRVIRPISGGGMGDVYLARRDDDVYRQEVAIKLVKAGLATPSMVRRFRGERQILANLRHPAIAQLIDGGTTRARQPYLVMEYIDGTAIDLFCDEGELQVADRLRLFRKVCGAVHFAHQNLIVHRDIKPGNILINADGDPKLLDFGIAKLLRAEDFPEVVEPTATGVVAVTPEYTSPEQLQGAAITTACDVYSLGVLLYILLTGHRPYYLDRGKPAELMRVVCEEMPPRPSSAVTKSRKVELPDGTVQELTPESVSIARGTDPIRLRRQLNGDLDNIVMRALAKEPERRYASAEQLGQDIDRFLKGLPVLARKDTLAYRASKFVARHRVAVAATVAVFLMLVSLIVALLVQREEIVAQRDRYRFLSDFLLNVFQVPDPTRARGVKITARELLDRAARDIENELNLAPEVRAELLTTMGRSYKNLGLFGEASARLETAVELNRQAFGDINEAVAASLHEHADALILGGDYENGLDLERESLAIRRKLHGDEHASVVESLYHVALAHEKLGEFDLSDDLYNQALTTARSLGQAELLAQVLGRYAILLVEKGEHDDAEARLLEAHEIYDDLFGDLHPESALSLNNLAALNDSKGEYEEAERLYRDAEGIQRQLFDGSHPHLATTLNNLALVVKKRGRLEEAEAIYQKALEMREEVYGDEHPLLADTLVNIADVLSSTGRREPAEELLRDALEMRREHLGNKHADTATSLDKLAQILVDKGDYENAEPMYREALQITSELLGSRHWRVGTKLNNLADLAFDRGRYDEAEQLYRQALSIQREALGEDHPDVATVLYNLASLLRAKDDKAAADETFAAAVDVGRAALGEDHLNVALAMTSWSELKNNIDEYAEAQRLAETALPILEQKLSPDHPWAFSARGYLAESLRQQGQYTEAEPLLLACLEYHRESSGTDSPQTLAVVEGLMRLYDAWHRPGEAAKYRALLPEEDR